MVIFPMCEGDLHEGRTTSGAGLVVAHDLDDLGDAAPPTDKSLPGLFDENQAVTSPLLVDTLSVCYRALGRIRHDAKRPATCPRRA
jgi:hypothetical protein